MNWRDKFKKAKERANTARSATPDAFLYESGNIMDAPITMHSSDSPSEFRQEEIPPNESTSSQPADDLPEQPEQVSEISDDRLVWIHDLTIQ